MSKEAKNERNEQQDIDELQNVFNTLDAAYMLQLSVLNTQRQIDIEAAIAKYNQIILG